MNKFVVAIIFIVLSNGVLAQSPNQIISQANKALGGEKALQRISSRQIIGRITRVRDGATGKYQFNSSQPNYYGGVFDFNDFERAVGYNGKSAWTRDDKNGLRTLTDEESKTFQFEAVFRNSRWLNAKADGLKITYDGISSVKGKKANVITLTNSKGIKIKLHFEAASGLLCREEIPQGVVMKIYEYGDYRNVYGVQEPFSISLQADDERYEIKLDDVKHNQPIAKADFDFPKNANETMPDIKALVAEVRANAEKLDQILENYSYTETETTREIDKNGSLIEKGSQTTLLSFYKGKRITRLIAKNGKPLSANDEAAEDKNVQKQIETIDKGINAGKPPISENDNLTIANLLRNSTLINPRRERLRERDVIVFDFEPNSTPAKRSLDDQLFAMCTGAVWIDEQYRQVVRVDAYLTKNVGNFALNIKQGGSFSLENGLVNNEIYLPIRSDFNVSVRLLLATLKFSSIVKSGDYQKFKAEAGDYKIGEIKKP